MSASSLSVALGGERLQSGVWGWDALPVEQTNSGERREIFAGEGADASRILVHATTLNPGQRPHAPHTHDDMEEMIVVKEGRLTITVGELTKEVGPGSVAIALAGDPHGWSNTGDEPVTYYVLRYKSRLGFDAEGDAEKRLSSAIYDSAEVPFSANPRGGWRGFFNGTTETLRLFELHETTLVQGVQNHPVHTHEAEEMVIMLEGHVDLQINGESYIGKPGDVYFVAANDPHSLFTHGEKPSRYFAFQWR
ncbi:cupin domain-containing protein [Actomonas aquatica]|uniref:Cupin domain-containing protein n=1 Tax=Actomonas aquatica TaxID=2866162 RepID=A0ABZ1CBD4_9BACT|nr:cupin domain-containing protein [Opitutus sp. WL0086]WRQ88866.1 cupin domain-containing protein [Opitutus sp. WL0086]